MSEHPGRDAVVPQKVRRPAATGLTRDRLEAPLRGSGAPRAVLVVAPPGAGKTTLLTHLAASAELRVCWYQAGPEDAAEAELVQYLDRTLRPGADPPLPRDATVDHLLAALGAASAEPLLLVVDDLHEIAGTDAEAALERFLRLRPTGIRVALASRRPPAFNAPRMLASSDLVEVDGDDLRFRSWEVEELFREVYREPLSPEAAALLTRRVGGLAAALQLFHLSTRGRSRPEREADAAALSGRSRLIRSYLTQTVLDDLDEDRRDFMVRTSVLGVLDGPLCDALLGRSDSASVLRGLERDQLFTTSPDEGLSYRYHQVLRSHLEVLLVEELPSAEVDELFARAGELLERAGQQRAALEAYTRAGDWGAATRLVRRGRVVPREHDGDAWPPAHLPAALREDPWLALAHGRSLLRQGSIDAAVEVLRAMEDSVEDAALRAHCAHERASGALWQRRPAPAAPGTTLATVRALTRRAVAPTTPVGVGPESDLVTGLALALAGRPPPARRLLGRALSQLAADTWPRLAAGLAGAVLDFAELDGDQRCRVVEEIALSADVHGYPWLSRVAQGVQASAVLQASGQPWRAAACQDVVDACRRDGDLWGELLVRIFTAVAHARLGDRRAALAGLDRAASVAGHVDAPVLAVWVRALTLVAAGTAPAARAADEAELRHAGARVGLDVTDVLAVCRAAVTGPPLGRGGAGSTGTRVECLGGFRLVVDGVAADLSVLRPRARTVLMLLALHHGRDVHRELLVAHLWPDVGLEQATHRLQVAVSSVRQVLDAAGLGWGALQRRGDAYRLELSGAAVDIAELDERLTGLTSGARLRDPVTAVGEVAAVLAAYRGDLLPEVGTAEWVLAERDRLRVATATALVSAARTCLSHGYAAEALRAAQRAVELDPYRDTAWLLRAEIEETMGDHSAALVTRAEHSRLCADLAGTDALRRSAPDGPRARV